MVDNVAAAEGPNLATVIGTAQDPVKRQAAVIEAMRAGRTGKAPAVPGTIAKASAAAPPAQNASSNAQIEGDDFSGQPAEAEPEVQAKAGVEEPPRGAEPDWGIKVPVKVSGELKEVELRELRDSYASQGELQRLANAMVDSKKTIDSTRDQYLERVESAKRLAISLMGESPDPLKYSDSMQYLQDKAMHEKKIAALKTIDDEIEKGKSEKAREAEAQLRELVAAEYPKILKAIPTFEKDIGPLMEYAKSRGVPDSMTHSPQPAYIYEAFHKAKQWDELQAGNPATVNKLREARPMAKAGASNPQDNNREINELKDRLGSSRLLPNEKEKIVVRLRHLTGQSRQR